MNKHDGSMDERLRVRHALERATDGVATDVGPLVDAVPGMLREARRRRMEHRRTDALTASIPFARTAIPRLAAAAALLVAITTVLVLSGYETSTMPAASEASPTASVSSADDWLFAESEVSEEQILHSLIRDGESR